MTDAEIDISTDEVAILIKRAGLNLNEEEFKSLCDALAHVVEKSRRVGKGLTQTDEPAFAFRVTAEN